MDNILGDYDAYYACIIYKHIFNKLLPIDKNIQIETVMFTTQSLINKYSHLTLFEFMTSVSVDTILIEYNNMLLNYDKLTAYADSIFPIKLLKSKRVLNDNDTNDANIDNNTNNAIIDNGANNELNESDSSDESDESGSFVESEYLSDDSLDSKSNDDDDNDDDDDDSTNETDNNDDNKSETDDSESDETNDSNDTNNETELNEKIISFNKHKYPEYELCTERLKTFYDHGWYKSNIIHPIELSEAGFYYSGSDDRVVCWSCGLELIEWCEGDNPFIGHFCESPNCRYLNSSIIPDDKEQINININDDVNVNDNINENKLDINNIDINNIIESKLKIMFNSVISELIESLVNDQLQKLLNK